MAGTGRETYIPSSGSKLEPYTFSRGLYLICNEQETRDHLTLQTRPLLLLSKILYPFSNFRNVNVYFTTSWTNIRHVCTYLKAFFLVFSNMVMEFHNFDILFTNLVTFLTCCLHSPAAWKALTTKELYKPLFIYVK